MKYVCVITALAFMGNSMCVRYSIRQPTHLEPVVELKYFMAALAVCAGGVGSVILINGQRHPRIKIAAGVGAVAACAPAVVAIKKILEQRA